MKDKQKKKKNESNLKDTIIKIILIIVILLLLLHNCSLVRKKADNKSKTPSGNVNVIELICDDRDTCTNKNINTESSTDDKEEQNDLSGNRKASRGGNNKSSGNANTNISGSSAPNTSNVPGGTNNSSGNESSVPNESSEESSYDEDGQILVKDNTVKWRENTELKIFTNSYYYFEDKIAPESSNTYKFIVKNSTDLNLKYDINFTEENPYNINMKYRLKKNGTYIVNNYVSFNELDIKNQLLNSKNEDTFYLDWKWFSSDHDNEAGENAANYKLKILVKAESIDA